MVGLINTSARPVHTDYSIMNFPNWKALQDFALKVKNDNPSSIVETANESFKDYVEQTLRNPNSGNIKSYGLFGKQPKTYKEAMERETFLYYDEYKEIKKKVEKKIAEELQKSSIAETMKPKLVYNDKEIGEFVFDRAAMALLPEIFYYSPSKKREVDVLNEKIIEDGNVMVLASDRTAVVYAFKIETDEKDAQGKIIYIYYEVKGEHSLEEASKLGVVQCTSSNKKVFLYKEKKPKQYNAIKIITGLTAGGFTSWTNDFYTGIATGVVVEVLESLGYSVHVEIAMGGGRCAGCYRKLFFDGRRTHGRRFFTFTAKSFDESLDTDGLLYTLCDPSFHNIKFISLLNYFFKFFGDEIDTRGNPSSTWHGIGGEDMMSPIGAFERQKDFKRGDKNLLHFYIHKVKDEAEVIQQITNLVLTAENINLEVLKKYATHDYGIDS